MFLQRFKKSDGDNVNILVSSATTFVSKYISKYFRDLTENAIKKNRSEIANIMMAIKAGFFNDTVKETLDKLEEEKKQLELEQLRLSTRTKNKIEIEALSFLYNLIELKSD